MVNANSTQIPSESKSQLRFIDIKAAISVYGGSEAWWRKAVWQRRLTTYRRGGRVVFKPEDLEAYFEARCIPAAPEAANQQQTAASARGRLLAEAAEKISRAASREARAAAERIYHNIAIASDEQVLAYAAHMSAVVEAGRW